MRYDRLWFYYKVGGWKLGDVPFSTSIINSYKEMNQFSCRFSKIWMIYLQSIKFFFFFFGDKRQSIQFITYKRSYKWWILITSCLPPPAHGAYHIHIFILPDNWPPGCTICRYGLPLGGCCLTRCDLWVTRCMHMEK